MVSTLSSLALLFSLFEFEQLPNCSYKSHKMNVSLFFFTINPLIIINTNKQIFVNCICIIINYELLLSYTAYSCILRILKRNICLFKIYNLFKVNIFAVIYSSHYSTLLTFTKKENLHYFNISLGDYKHIPKI